MSEPHDPLHASIPPVSAADLAEAVNVRNRNVPISRFDTSDIEETEGGDGISDREDRIDEELVETLGAEIGEAAGRRAFLLCQVLTRDDPLYHDVAGDGLVSVDKALLAFAASTPLLDDPDERIDWPERD
jgi:hypothetical protein